MNVHCLFPRALEALSPVKAVECPQCQVEGELDNSVHATVKSNIFGSMFEVQEYSQTMVFHLLYLVHLSWIFS